MPWDKSAADRRRDAAIYASPAYRAARNAARQRAGGRCEQCGKRARLECDHITPVTQGGNHSPANLQMLCGPCHARKTAGEGGGWRAARTVSDPDPEPRTTWN